LFFFVFWLLSHSLRCLLSCPSKPGHQ
jgi:hypothetical protein